jgi:hypothetical protein
MITHRIVLSPRPFDLPTEVEAVFRAFRTFPAKLNSKMGN